MRDYAFGDRLSALRQECGYSQFQLASLIGVSDKAVSKWETGVAKPRMKTCQRLAAVLGVDLDDLFSLLEHNSFPGGHAMNKKKLWAAAEERLYSLYGEEPDFHLINRFKAEQNFLRDTDAVVLFAAIARVRHIADEHGTLINVRGPLNGSFSAWLIGATVFNPLPAHTYCPKCRKIHFYQDVHDGFDLPKELCSCGCRLIRDGHNLPFETYMEKVKSNFCSVDCVVSADVISEAWKEVLGLLQDGYSCDRYVFQQTEETGFPGQFSRLYLNPKKNDIFYERIDDVPEISNNAMMMRRKSDCSSILLLDSKSDDMKIPVIPELEELLTPSVLQQAMQKNCAPEYYLDDISSFHELVQAEAASHATFKEGWDPIQFAAKNELSRYTELPLTREEVWSTIMKAAPENTGIASDILHNIRLGKYARGSVICDVELMNRMGLPPWFPEYASSVLYLFSKSHCIDFAYRNLVEAFNEQQQHA